MTDAVQKERCEKLVAIAAGWAYDVTLYALAVGLRAQLIYEVGVGDGLSTHALLSALIHTGGRLVSCDVREKCGQAVTLPEWRARWEFRHLCSREFVGGLRELADLIYIDDAHVPLSWVLWEVQHYWDVLKPDGLMVLHDTRKFPAGPGAAAQLVAQQGVEMVELPYAQGFAVIHKRGAGHLELGAE